MFKLDKGTLTMENIDLDHIKFSIDEGCLPIEALKDELEFSGMNINDVQSLELSFNQLSNKEYVDIYSQIVQGL